MCDIQPNGDRSHSNLGCNQGETTHPCWMLRSLSVPKILRGQENEAHSPRSPLPVPTAVLARASSAKPLSYGAKLFRDCGTLLFPITPGAPACPEPWPDGIAEDESPQQGRRQGISPKSSAAPPALPDTSTASTSQIAAQRGFVQPPCCPEGNKEGILP